MIDMDRVTRLFIANGLIERTRDYTKGALDDLFEAMDKIERRRGLVPKLTEEEEAAVAEAGARLARGEKLPELERRGRIEDFLPESDDAILARLRGLPPDEQTSIFDAIAQLIDIDAPPLKLSPAQIADLRRSLRAREEN